MKRRRRSREREIQEEEMETTIWRRRMFGGRD